MQFIKSSEKLPETSIHPIMGHGGLTLGQMRNIDRIRHGWEFFVPSVRKDNKIYYENLKDHAVERAGEYIARLHSGLRRDYALAQDSNLRLFIKGSKGGSTIPGFAFSDITAHSTVRKELTERNREQVRWGFFIVNACYGTTNLISAETSTNIHGEGSLDDVNVFNTGTGKSYSPTDYRLENQAHLYQTIDHIIDRLDFAVNHDSSRVVITQMGVK